LEYRFALYESSNQPEEEISAQVRLRTRVQQQSGGNAELTPATSSCAGNLEKKEGSKLKRAGTEDRPETTWRFQ
jgi:hypothetical protein